MIALPFHPSEAYSIRRFKENPGDILRECEKRAEKQFGGKVSLDLDAGTPWGQAGQVVLDELERAQVVLVRRQPDRDLGSRRRDQGVRRRLHGGGVDADHRRGRLGPHAGQQRVRSDGAHTVQQARLLSEPVLRELEVGGVPGAQALNRQVAVVVVQTGEHPHERHHGVRHRSAEHPGVDPMVEGRDGDDDADHAPKRRRQGRLADRPVHRVREHDRIGPQALAVSLQDRRQ